MPLDFGNIQNYDIKRGFGFVSHTVWTSSHEKVFFHIQKVKCKYLELARRIDYGDFFDISFWYSTENTSKGEKVKEIYLTAQEIPRLQRTELISYIKSLWRRNIQTHSWLDKITEELIGHSDLEQLREQRDKILRRHHEAEVEKARVEAEKRKREEERRLALERERIELEERRKAEERKLLNLGAIPKQARSNEIQRICNERKISTCIHFTHVQNLQSILHNGLLSRSVLDAKASELHIQPQYNDQYRLDGFTEAKRPIFIPDLNYPFVKEKFIEFQWYAGFSKVQAQKSIASLHESASKKGIIPVLEISSKSNERLGISLSAFNLIMEEGEQRISVECAYQGSKVFEKGGPYEDLYLVSSREAKTNERLKNSGELIGFSFFRKEFPTQPMTAFYDWLYIKALWQNRDLSEQLLKFQGFSDIAYNPKKSINCQAHAAALFVSLYKIDKIESVIEDLEKYMSLIGGHNLKESAKKQSIKQLELPL